MYITERVKSPALRRGIDKNKIKSRRRIIGDQNILKEIKKNVKFKNLMKQYNQHIYFIQISEENKSKQKIKR